MNSGTNHKKTKHTYLTDIVTFDIETTSFYHDGKKYATMYLWSACDNGNCVDGRTWGEFRTFLSKLKIKYGVNNRKRLVLWVHNLAYEFQFMRKHFLWQDVFMRDNRKIIYAVEERGFEFRCSYFLTNLSLDSLSRIYKLPTKKLVGTIDYTLPRHSDTELTETDYEYVHADVKVLYEYIQSLNVKISDIPLTKTGYLRRDVKRYCYSGYGNEDYRELMKRMSLTYEEYILLKHAYAGGFTHSNVFNTKIVLENVESDDLTSAYPAVQSMCKFPMGKGVPITPSIQDVRENIAKDRHVVFLCDILNIESTFPFENPISLSKCIQAVKFDVNNGRLISADRIRIALTELDLFTIDKFYKYDEIKVITGYSYYSDYLPCSFIEFILKLFEDKTNLKGIDGKEVEYYKSKEKINSLYGCCVTDIMQPDHIYKNDEYITIPKKVEDIEIYNTKHFISYLWGIYTTAYVRYDICNVIYDIGEYYCYSDTDSVKFIQNDDVRNRSVVKHNELVKRRIKNVCRRHGFDESDFTKKDVFGNTHTLGVFCYEGVYEQFKTLGAKRYMYTQNGKTHITVAGLNKKIGGEYICSQSNPYDFFDNDMFIPSKYTGKLCHTYIDEPFNSIPLTDLNGKTAYVSELSCVHLEPTEFSLSLSAEYKALLERIVYKNTTY